MGATAAAKLAWRFGGCLLYISRTPPPAARNRRIRELRRRGWSASRIAAATGLSDRSAYKILARSQG